MYKRWLSMFLVIALLSSMLPNITMIKVSAATDPNLKLWYQFDETSGTVVKDSSGNGQDATLSGGAVWSEGAVILDGVNGNVRMPNNLLAGITEITVITSVYVSPDKQDPSWFFSFGNRSTENTGWGANYLMATSAEGNPKAARFVISKDKWVDEQSVRKSGTISTGEWKNIAITIKKNSTDAKYTGTFYEDGVAVGTNSNMVTLPKDLGGGVTTENNLGRPAYNADKYFKGKISEFRMYDRALSESEINAIVYENLSDTEAVKRLKEKLSLGDLSAVAGNLTLPVSYEGGMAVSWESSNTAVMENNGTVHRNPEGEVIVQLTATISRGAVTETKTFQVTVLQAKTVITLDSDAYTLPFVHATHATVLTATYADGTTGDVTSQATITSSDPAVVSVSKAGLIEGLKEGSATITLNYLGKDYFVQVNVVKEPNLKLWYKLDEKTGTTAADSSGNGNDGTLSTGATWSTGKGGTGAAALNGSNGSIKMPDHILNGVTNVTVSTNVFANSVSRPSWVYGFGSVTDASVNGSKYMGLLAADNQGSNGNFRFTISTDKWTLEQSATRTNIPLGAGEWKNLTVTIGKNDTDSKYTAILYENGFEVGRNTGITILPKDLENTIFNYIGRPPYSGDRWFNGKVSDFRLYDRALSATEVRGLANQISFQDILEDADALTLGDVSAVKTKLVLPNAGDNGTIITWASENDSIISGMTGEVNRPEAGAGNIALKLTATLSKAGMSHTKTFIITVLEQISDEQSVALDKASLNLGNDIHALSHDLLLPAKGMEQSKIVWVSSQPEVLHADTGAISRPAQGLPDATVTLTATIRKGTIQDQKSFTVVVKSKEAYAGYLLSYFKTADESLYHAYSRDGLHWTTLNKGERILKPTIGNKSIRDPFIIRKQDGKYHLLSTDSWTSKNLLIYDSEDLVHWTNGRSVSFAPGNSTDAWAPEAYYDSAKNNYVVIWSSKVPGTPVSGEHRTYYRTTTDFVNFSAPKLFLDPGHNVIDPTVIEDAGKFYTYYKDERDNSTGAPTGKGIKMAVSGNGLIGTYDTASYPNAVILPEAEGPTVIKSFTENIWYLYADEYNKGTYAGYSATELASGAWTKLSAGDYQLPTDIRHGSIMEISEEEIETLLKGYATMVNIAAIELAIDTGESLQLPPSLDAQYSDGSIGRINVVWDAVDPQSYAAPGTFDVIGAVANSAIKARATVTVGGGAIKRPGGVVVTENGTSTMNLKWNASEGAESYNIYRSDLLFGTYTRINSDAITGTTFEDKGLREGTTYYYAVSGVNSSGESAKSDRVTARTGAAFIENGAFWYADNGDKIQAHGGGMIKVGDTFYWFGEDKSTDQAHFYNIKVYASKDLKSWTFRNNVLTQTSRGLDGQPAQDLADSNIERPKVLYNEKTKKYVLWMHYENGQHYGLARVAVATSDTIDGNYTYIDSFRPNPADPNHEGDPEAGKDSRDMTVFKDTDGSAYLFSSSSVNADMILYKLTDDYTGVAAELGKIYSGPYREAPAVVKKGELYYLITSGASGWYPNQAMYSTTKTIADVSSWTTLKNIGNTSSFYTQSAYIFTVEGTEETSYILHADRWNPAKLGDSKYIWLPLTLNETNASMEFYEQFDMDAAKGSITIPPTNPLISQGKPAAAQSSRPLTAEEDFTPSKANDGSYDTSWTASTGTWPHWWRVDLGAEYDLSNIQISWFMYKGSEAYYPYKIEISDDDVHYTVALDRTNNTTYGFTSDKLTGKARYVRVNMVNAVLHNNPNNWYTPQLYEVKVFGTLRAPAVPIGLGTIGVQTQGADVSKVNVKWNSVSGASLYKLYRADDAAGPYMEIYSGSTVAYSDTGLQSGKTYYYKIRSQNDAGESELSKEASATTFSIPATSMTFTNGENWWNDEEGNSLGLGGFFKAGSSYYFLIGSKENGKFKNLVMYQSADLKTWTFSQTVLESRDHPELAEANLEGVQIVYNKSTNKYIMWMHYENGVDYGLARVAAAYSDTPDGKYTFTKSYRPNGNESRDLTVYVDDDGAAYLISSASVNADLKLYKLTSDYLSVEKEMLTIYTGKFREAPTIVKKDGIYFLITSGASGWYPNQAMYSTATSMEGPWSELKKLGNGSSFSAQSGGVVTIKGDTTTSYIWNVYRWLGDAKQMWMPLILSGTTAYVDYTEQLSVDFQSGVVVPISNGDLLSQGKPATAENETLTNPASLANDGDYSTTWSALSNYSWPKWWKVDLGDNYDLTNVQISWPMVQGSEGYYKYRIETSSDDVYYDVSLDRTGITEYGFTTDTIAVNARYVKIVLVDAVLHNNPNNNWYTPQMAEVKVFGYMTGKPEGLSAVSLTASTVKLDWVELPNALSYNVYRKAATDGSFKKINTAPVGSGSFTDTALKPGTAYEYRITAIKDGVESVFSAIAKATTKEWVRVNSITIGGSDGLLAITEDKGSLQLNAEVQPSDATDPSLTWTVANEDGTQTNLAVMNANGLLTAVKDGKVKVTAASGDGSGVTGSAVVTISGQVVEPGTPPNSNDPKADNGMGSSDVSEQDLRNVKNGSVTVEVKAGKTEISLPGSTAAILGKIKLIIKRGDVTIVIPSEVLRDLTNLASGMNVSGLELIVRLKPVDELSVDSNHPQLKSGGYAYDLDLFLRTKEQKEYRLSQFAKAVSIVLPFEENKVDDQLIGIYYYNDLTALWEYVGGVIDIANRTVSTDVAHFSKYAVLEYNKSFKDLPRNHWAFQTVKVLAAKHIVTGVTSGEFKPNDKTTRAEFIALFTRALGLRATGKSMPFSDVSENAWYVSDVAAAYEAGLIQGTTDNKFDPNATITREQMAALLVRAYTYSSGNTVQSNLGLDGFKDNAKVSLWAKQEVTQAISVGLMKGDGKQLFNPRSEAVRAETAQAIYNLLKLIGKS
ncbi:immunoglobulin-like domain-containing protein [Paenibacillus luteus]|uniref:immunoglobulin-like domain-containing protein n=1 Tax=Paenibacillus luteus TaxID=2545753 RepID=UPI001143F393|nr:immunoglobulin-like domain-containing protein [Paenibacillus luteus]